MTFRNSIPLTCAFLVVSAMPCVAAERWKDASNGYSVEIPLRWVSVSPDVITMLNTNIGRFLQTNIRYSTCFVPAGKTSQELPRILVQFQAWEGGVPTHDALEESLKRDVGPAMKQVQKESNLPISSIEVGETQLDRENNRMILRMRTSVPGDGMVEGLSIGMLGKHGVVFLHCYGKADKFARMVPFFETVAETFKFDPGHTYDPAEATVSALPQGGSSRESGFRSFSWTGASRGGLIGACIGGAVGAVAMAAKFLRRRVL